MYRRQSTVEAPKFGLVRGAQPVRRIKPRIARNSVPCEFPTAKGTLPILRTESLDECNGLALFEADPDVVLMAVQPHFLRYVEPQPDGSTIWRKYCPDLAVLMADGSVVVVDFKPAEIASGKKWLRKSKLLEEAYLFDHDVTFLTITDAMVRIEPRRSNVNILMLHREVRPDHEAKIAVLAFLDRRGLPMTVGDVSRGCPIPHRRPDVDRAYSALMNLVLDGVVALDMSLPLGDASVLSWRPTAPAAALRAGCGR